MVCCHDLNNKHNSDAEADDYYQDQGLCSDHKDEGYK